MDSATSLLPDVRDIPLAELAMEGAAGTTAVLDRVLAGTEDPAKVSTTAFNSSI
jgi:FXSXX-COOH protein